jgi:hypothetical protein
MDRGSVTGAIRGSTMVRARRPADPQALSRLEGGAAPATDGDAAADESGDEPESTDAADE